MPHGRQIVIVTEPMDSHADALIPKLSALGHTPLRLHTEDFPLLSTLDLALGGAEAAGWRGQIRTRTRSIDLGAIRSIWWRRPKMFRLPPGLERQQQEFARFELDHVLQGLWASLDCYWVSFPGAIRQANWKVSQLKRAAALGFDVPRTLITSDPAQARGFYEQCGGRAIYKPLSDPTLAAMVAQEHDPAPISTRLTYTTLLDEHHLARLESVRLAPCLFQEYVPKRLELRVTVIGDDVFAAEIHSQEHESTSVDWRHYEVEIPYRKAELPVEVAERCLRLVKGYGLNYSAMDLILTPDGRYVFLENNPNGQFLFIERKVPELPLLDALAACLIRGSSEQG
ncbi:MAG TPA: hypothetical protein VFS21_22245 [Roseiflexaceae bacterium]|nr:hypothetical protein [Roseiflexaceae bacterium]